MTAQTGSPRRRRVLVSALVTLLAAGLLAGCGGSGDSARLTIYSGRTQELIEPLLEDFSHRTGIGIDVRYGDSSDLALLIEEEGDASPADVFLSQSPGSMGFLDSRGRLVPVDAESLSQVPERFRAHDDRWVGVSARIRVLAYNPTLVNAGDLPQSVFDLTAPRYRGQVGVAPPNASFQDFVTAMREREGQSKTRAWLEGLVANGVRTYPNNIAIVEAIGRGEIRYGLVNDYYLYELQLQNPDLKAKNAFFPASDIGSLMLATTVGILGSADNPGDAARLIDFLLSKRAQRFYAEKTYEYPLAQGVEADPKKPAFDSLQGAVVDLSQLGSGLVKTRKLLVETGLAQA